jgi:imidazolonepropionase-like amidohydrolase
MMKQTSNVGTGRSAWSGRLLSLAIAPIALSCATPERDVLAIRDVTVFPATGASATEGLTVLIRGTRIDSIGPASRVEVPEGARVIEGRGGTLIPGLIEMHAHVSKTRASALGLFVAHGVTTVRDVGGDHQELVRWRGEVRSGTRLGPRLLLAGPYLESASNIERMRGDPPESRVEPFERARIGIATPDQARSMVDSLAGLDVDFLKIRTVQDLATYRALNQAADANGLQLVGHVSGLSPETVIEAGQDGIEHWFYPTLDSLSREARMTLWRGLAQNGVVVVPTLVVMEKSALAPPEQLRAMLADSLGEVEPRRRYISRFLLADWAEQLLEIAGPEQRPLLEQAYDSTIRNVREMHEAGVTLVTGSDVAVLNIYPGSSLHDEIVLFVERLGMTPQEALERATRMPAEFLGIADSVGTVAAGNVADLVLLEASPLDDIRNVNRVAAVILRGRAFEQAELAGIVAATDTALDQRINDWQRESGPPR